MKGTLQQTPQKPHGVWTRRCYLGLSGVGLRLNGCGGWI